MTQTTTIPLQLYAFILFLFAVCFALGIWLFIEIINKDRSRKTLEKCQNKLDKCLTERKQHLIQLDDLKQQALKNNSHAETNYPPSTMPIASGDLQLQEAVY